MVIFALCLIHRKTASFYGISFSAGTDTTSYPPFILALAANLLIHSSRARSRRKTR